MDLDRHRASRRFRGTLGDPFDHKTILVGCVAGDEALRRLHQHEPARPTGAALRITRSHEAARDIPCNSFVRIWPCAVSLDSVRGPARAWVHPVVRHRALNAIRARQDDVERDRRRRTSILLGHIDGRRHPQIATCQSLPLGTVEARIRRSELALKDHER